MSSIEMQEKPLCRAEDLGHPIPNSRHAVSMALPRWQDVVGYEEHKPEVMSQLRGGYPRFVIHPLIQELAKRLEPNDPCLPFPTARAAQAGVRFIEKMSGAPARLVSGQGVFGVATRPSAEKALRAFWQHAGLIVSSRRAEALLNGRGEGPDADQARRSLRRQLAGFYGCGEDDIFLTVTGMAAQYYALLCLGRRRPGQPTVQLGFPYVDTLKIQQKIGAGGILLHQLDHIASDLRDLLKTQAMAGCFAEIPGNPLLGSADVRQVTPVLREYGVPFVVDDVVATPFNIDLRPHADLIATSLTKFVLGTGDGMGGAVICNPASPYYAELKSLLITEWEEMLWGDDAELFEQQARGFPERMRQHNANGLLIAERLRAHPRVERVWYPKWEFSEVYEAVRRPQGGWGALVTFLPKDAESSSQRIYDALPVCKGPSLGTIFTLACPFTMIAHYCELDWAESCGVSRFLIRLSIGLEDPHQLWKGIDRALSA